MVLFVMGEFIVDKIPVIDHLSDAVHTVIRPLSGAAIMAGISNPLSDHSLWAAAILGALLALVVHGVKAASRPAVTATTAGLGNPIISLIEDRIVVIVSLPAPLAPVVALALLRLL